jgi:uncharacterized membrane protein
MALTAIVEDDRTNAAIAWGVVSVTALATAASAVLGGPAWSLLAGAAVAVAVVPAAAFRDPSVMPPWEVLAVVALPTASRFFALPDALADTAIFVAIVALSVLIVAELHVFSPVEMPPRFAAVLVVLLTMATAGLWTLVQYGSDAFFGTALIADQTSLMWDLVIATAVSVIGGPLVGYYFRRQAAEGGRSFRARSSAGGGER